MKRTLFSMLLIIAMGMLFAQTATLPFSEDFEGNTFPPLMWANVDANDDGSVWVSFEGTARSYSTDEFTGEAISPDNWLITPSFLFEESKSYTIEFDRKSWEDWREDELLSIYLMTSNASESCVDDAPGNTTLWSQITTATWETVTIEHTPAANEVRFIGFRHHNQEGQITLQIDNVLIYETVEYDLGITNLTGPAYYSTTIPFIFSVRNFGTETVEANGFTIQLYYSEEGETPVALGDPIAVTPAISPATTEQVYVNNTSAWGFDVPDITIYQIYAVLSLTSDAYSYNNTSNTISVTVYPNNIGLVDLMSGTDYYSMPPIVWFNLHCISQMIFTAEELGGVANFGKISEIAMKLRDFDIPATSVQIYFANAPTSMGNFTSASDYYPYANFTKVYDAPLFTDGGSGTIREFMLTMGTGAGTQDFVYEGGNLVMMMYKTDTQPRSFANFWFSNETLEGETRGIYMHSSEMLINVEYPDTNGMEALTFEWTPKIRFFIEKAALGTLSGSVTVAGSSTPIPNARVFATNHPSIYTETDAFGAYTLADVATVFDISVVALGYFSQEFPADEIDWDDDTHTATLDVQMIAMPSGLSISGYVKAADNGEGRNGVTIKLTGYIEDELTTTTFDSNDGYFIFSNLYGGNDYTITVEYTGFTTEVREVTLTEVSVTLPDITLIELIKPPLSVGVMVNTTSEEEAIVSWVNPFWGTTSFSHSRAGFSNAIGFGNIKFTVAHRYTSEQIEGFGATGNDVYKVGFIPYHYEGATYTIKAWVTEDPILEYPIGLNPVVEVAVASVRPRVVNEVVLPTLVSVPVGGQLFIGFEIDTPGGFPPALDEDNYLNRYGNLIYVNGAWQTLFDIIDYVTGNWCIYVHTVEPEAPGAPYPTPAPVLSTANDPASSEPMSLETITHSLANIGESVTFDNYYLGHTPNRLTRALNGEFEIYRMLAAASIPSTPIHTTTNLEANVNFRNMRYIDNNWGALPQQVYKYAVRTKYAGSAYEGGYQISQPQYSNGLLKAQTVSVTVNVTRQGESVEGAFISFGNDNLYTPNQSYRLLPTDNGSHTFTVYSNIPYQVTVAMAGTPSYSEEHIFSALQNTLDVNLLSFHGLFTETFHGEQPAGWVTVDADEDWQTWKFNDASISGPNSAFTATYSESMGEWYNPDNWLISPPIELSTGGRLDFSFMIAAQLQYQFEDRLVIYIAPASEGVPSWQTFLVNRDPDIDYQGNPNNEVLQTGVEMLDYHIVQQHPGVNGFYTLSYDISHYAGESVRIAFRHAFCPEYGGFIVKIANMAITKVSFVPIAISGSVVDTAGAPLTGATVTISSTPPISTTTEESGEFTLIDVPGEATYTVTASKYGFTASLSQITVSTTDYAITTPISMAIVKDLGITSLTGPTYLIPSGQYTATIQNFGGEAVEAGSYTIQYYYNLPGETPAVLGTAVTATPAIASGATVEVDFCNTAEWGFDVNEVTAYELFAVLTHAGDQNVLNNTSHNVTIIVYPQGIGVVDLMGGDVANSYYHPINWYWYNSLSQTIYTVEDLGGFANYGQVRQLMFKVNDIGVPATNVQIYLANAPITLTSFTSTTDYYPYAKFVKVYDAPLFTDGGQNISREFMLTLGTGEDTEDFTYEGGNIVLMMFKEDDNSYDYCYWYHNPGITGVSRSVSMATFDLPNPIDIENPDPSVFVEWNVVETSPMYSKARFFIERGDLGTLSGRVTIADTTTPIEGARVYVTDYPYAFTETDASGMYTLDGIPTIFGVSVSAFGYFAQDIQADDIDWDATTLTATLNVQMVSLPSGLSISGYVKTADNGVGVNGITVTLSGYTGEVEMLTRSYENSDGYYEFDNIYGGHTYTITARYHGFITQVREVEVIETSVSVADITLIEIVIPPHRVTAEVNATNQGEAIITWINPLWGFTSFSHANLSSDAGVGTGGANIYLVAHRYSAEQLASFGVAGYDVDKVGFVPWHFEGATYTVRVWVTTSNTAEYPIGLTPVVEVAVTSVSTQEINEVILPTSVPIPEDGQLFVGYEIFTSGGYVAGINYSKHLNGYGNLIFDMGEWSTLTDLNADLSGSWCIYVTAIEPENPSAPYPPTPVVFSNVTDFIPIKPASRHTRARMTALNTGQPISFGDYHLGHTPNRVTRALQGEFELYRIPAGDIIPATPFHTTTSEEVNVTYRSQQYIDTQWGTIPEQVYQYAVKTRYAGSQYEGGHQTSEARYSNNLLKGVPVSLTVNVYMHENSVAGAVISISNDIPETPNLTYTLIMADNGSHGFTVYKNVPYVVKVVKSGSTTYSQVHTFTEMTNTLNVNLLVQDVFFIETFSGDMPADWTNIDADNDGNSWTFNNYWIPGPGGVDVDTAAHSHSKGFDPYLWDYFPLYPDNWLISPEIEIPNESSIIFEYLISSTPDPTDNHIADRLLVYIAPAGENEPGWGTFLLNRDTTTGIAGNPNNEALQLGADLLDDHIVIAETFYKLEYDITQYAGETVRIAFRHAFCEDSAMVILANMVVSSASYVPITVTGSVVDDSDMPVANAIVSLSSTPPIVALTNNSGVFTLTGVPGNAIYTVTVSKQNYLTNSSTQITVSNTDYTITEPIVIERALDEADVTKPTVTVLKVNYPNPFNPTTTIAFDLAKEGAVSIDIYNIKGQKVKTLVNDVRAAGFYKVVWNGQDSAGRDVSSGIYFYRMRTEGYSSVRKMLLMK